MRKLSAEQNKPETTGPATNKHMSMSAHTHPHTHIHIHTLGMGTHKHGNEWFRKWGKEKHFEKCLFAIAKSEMNVQNQYYYRIDN